MAICRFTLAVDRARRREGEQGADFIRITVFDRQAENCNRYLAKGRQAAISGRIQTGSYTDRDGNKVFTTDVIADRVEFLGGNSENSRSDARNNANGNSYQPQQNNAPQAQNGVQWDMPDSFTAAEDDIPF